MFFDLKSPRAPFVYSPFITCLKQVFFAPICLFVTRWVYKKATVFNTLKKMFLKAYLPNSVTTRQVHNIQEEVSNDSSN